jgi:hypothetical protein
VPTTTSDEQEVGWGDDLEAIEDDGADDERLEADRPPHYDRD